MKNEKNLKKYYQKKEACYCVYDLSNNEVCIGNFDTLEDLFNYLQDNNYTNEKTKVSSLGSLKALISQHNLINNRLEIVKVCFD